MTTTLQVIAEQMAALVPNGIGRYSEELTRELIASAPARCEVEAIVAAHPKDELAKIRNRLPGLAHLTTAPLPPKELARAWQYGVRVPIGGNGMVHSPSLLAPLFKHDRLNHGGQVAVTIHDAVPWMHGAEMHTSARGWRKAMAKRALKHADAVIVPTHAVARQLDAALDFGDRIRVIGGAVGSTLRVPSDSDARARDLGLPSDYVLAISSLNPRKALGSLIEAMSLPGAAGLPLVVVGPEEWHGQRVSTAAMEAGLPEGRVLTLGPLDDGDLSVVLDRAGVFVYPSLAEGFGLPVLEAFHFGTPVIHSDDPALLEVSGGAGIAVERTATGSSYPERLADAIGLVLSDGELAGRLRVFGQDRVRAFSWRDSAQLVWQLHADL
ncbi:glycosyltransferase family 4 protein [Rathayibacter soli]|uniref:glycosyltransferase family 4 protein n=1 Tax=Rathayibacter soli TaxID=3144168 RepID=UPI0027E3CC9B|nr:glycosyltransferase family 1 protein [Glaciibacter superstes]